jgi:uracil-DNA glycosylase
MLYSMLWRDLPPEWATLAQMQAWFKKPERIALEQFLTAELALAKIGHGHVLPEQPFTALHDLSPEAVRVVILGQDPYHGIEPGLLGMQAQACGRAFAVSLGMKPPPSLRNIFKGIAQDLGQMPDSSGTTLTGWAQQGVLLLNTVLTVRQDQAASHAGYGWEGFTDAIIDELAMRAPRVWLLWGAYAQKKINLIQSHGIEHCILRAPHPSPLSAHRGFFSANHFSLTNQWLLAHGQQPIDWLRTQ